MTRAFWLSLTFLAVFTIVWGVFTLGGLDETLAEFAAQGASALLSLLTSVEIRTASSDGVLWFHVAGIERLPVQAALVIVYLPLFVAVIYAATPRFDRRFWLVLGVGVTLIFGLETLTLAARLWDQASSTLGGGAVFRVFQLVLKLSERGLAAVPTFVGALVLWSPAGLRRAASAPAAPDPDAANEAEPAAAK